MDLKLSPGDHPDLSLDTFYYKTATGEKHRELNEVSKIKNT